MSLREDKLMKLQLKLEESSREIRSRIAGLLAEELDSLFRSTARNIRQPLQNLVEAAIRRRPEYESMVAAAGELRGALGLVDPKQRLDDILAVWKNSLTMTIKPVRAAGVKLTGGFTLEMINSDYQDVINLAAASFISEHSFLIPWLEWLLIAGSRPVVKNWNVEYDLNTFQRDRSRTGLALMIRSSGSWSVPDEYAGTMSNNFVTRALEDAESDIINLFEKELNI